MRLIPLLILFLLGSAAYSQDISGKWIAKSAPNAYYFTPQKIVVELKQHNDSILSGVIHYYYPQNYYEHFRLVGKINRKTNTVWISEDSLINYRIQPGATIVSGNFYMVPENKKPLKKMEGIWKPFKPGDPSLDYLFEREVVEKAKDTAVVPVKELKPERIDKITQVLEVDVNEADSIRIDVYDNGEVDGDTVTVSINNRIVIARKRISDKPITFTTSLDKQNPIAQIRMIAENLGSIPPNTALMIITTKHNRYTVRLSSDLKTNGVIELFLRQ